jgi:ribonuclease P protein component
VQTADFKRVLAAPTRSRSAHFAVHYVNGGPATGWKPRPAARSEAPASELSTGDAPDIPGPVDDLPASAANSLWLGTVVPKRHAKRAVTRSLIKRQMRAMLEAHADRLPPGLWVLRLRSSFVRGTSHGTFQSAASEALRLAARTELDQVLAQAARPMRAPRLKAET